LCDQGAAIALTQKLITVVDKQLKSLYSCKRQSGEDACSTSSYGCTAKKSSSGKNQDHPYFSYEMNIISPFLFVINLKEVL
jgi:protein farnesyltransferase subunit beta